MNIYSFEILCTFQEYVLNYRWLGKQRFLGQLEGSFESTQEPFMVRHYVRGREFSSEISNSKDLFHRLFLNISFCYILLPVLTPCSFHSMQSGRQPQIVSSAHWWSFSCSSSKIRSSVKTNASPLSISMLGHMVSLIPFHHDNCFDYILRFRGISEIFLKFLFPFYQ